MAYNSLFRDRFPAPSTSPSAAFDCPPGIIRRPFVFFLGSSFFFSFQRLAAPFSNLDQGGGGGRDTRKRTRGSSARTPTRAQRPPFFRRNSKFERDQPAGESSSPPFPHPRFLPRFPPAFPSLENGKSSVSRSAQSSLRILESPPWGDSRTPRFVPAGTAEFTSIGEHWRAAKGDVGGYKKRVAPNLLKVHQLGDADDASRLMPIPRLPFLTGRPALGRSRLGIIEFRGEARVKEGESSRADGRFSDVGRSRISGNAPWKSIFRTAPQSRRDYAPAIYEKADLA